MSKPHNIINPFLLCIFFIGMSFATNVNNVNASGVLRNYGLSIEYLSLLWFISPAVGLIIYPVVGYISDHHYSRFGRRKPYIFLGSIIFAIGMLLMPNAQYFQPFLSNITIGIIGFALLDIGYCMTMESYRSIAIDNTNKFNRTRFFAASNMVLGISTIISAFTPYFLTKFFNVNIDAPIGVVGDNIRYTFFTGAFLIGCCLVFLVLKIKEYPPQEYEKRNGKSDESRLGIKKFVIQYFKTLKALKVIGFVQFFSWFGIYVYWIYGTDLIASHTFGLSPGDTSSNQYRLAQLWSNILFGVAALTSVLYSFFITTLSIKLGKKNTHAISLIIASLGLLSAYFMPSPKWLIPMACGLGMSYASINILPYSILGYYIKPGKIGSYTAVLNAFMVIPQIMISLVGGILIKTLFNENVGYMTFVSSGSLFMSAVISWLVLKEKTSEMLPHTTHKN
jgi:maltose/moltooligosaccharide transporter